MYNAVIIPFRCAFAPDLTYWLVLSMLIKSRFVVVNSPCHSCVNDQIACDYLGDVFLWCNLLLNFHLQMSRRGEPETLQQVQER
jgi:hypothetical protein